MNEVNNIVSNIPKNEDEIWYLECGVHIVGDEIVWMFSFTPYGSTWTLLHQ